jgi:hypothetical protein
MPSHEPSGGDEMNRPKDIPEDVWDDAGDLIDDWAIEFSLAVVISGNIGHVLHQRIARAILAYGQRRADEARESAAQACEMNYLANPILLAAAIRSQK